MAAGRGLFDEGPSACPFVALDRDRDRRADEPDTRHRCYATPTPEPRALIHQRNYCLTKDFSACPIFQDWAIRAAARPVPLRPVPPAVALMEEESRPVGEPELSPADEPVVVASDEPLQEGLFDEPPRASHGLGLPGVSAAQTGSSPPAAAPVPPAVLPPAPPMPTFRLTAADDDEPPPVETGPAVIPPPARPRPLAGPDGPASPRPTPAAMERLPSASRQAAPASPPKPTPGHPLKTRPTLRREDIVPSWERAQYDIPDPSRTQRSSGGGGDLFSRLTMIFTALAVVALFGVLIVFLVPSLLRGVGSGPTATPAHTAAGSPTVAPSPTIAPSPEASWQTYTIKLNDNLYAIAARFGLTYDQLLGANPQITNPDFIRAGDVLNIPPPNFVIPSASGGAASEEPSATP